MCTEGGVTYGNLCHTAPVFTVYIMEKLHSFMFFDEEIQTSIFYPTLHDAVLHALELHKDEQGRVVRNCISVWLHPLLLCCVSHRISFSSSWQVPDSRRATVSAMSSDAFINVLYTVMLMYCGCLYPVKDLSTHPTLVFCCRKS